MAMINYLVNKLLHTQKDIAQLLGISPGHLSRLLDGSRKVSKRHLEKLKEYLRAMARTSPYPEFDPMSLDDLRLMLREVLKCGPEHEDGIFVRRISQAIALREQENERSKETDAARNHNSEVG